MPNWYSTYKEPVNLWRKLNSVKSNVEHWAVFTAAQICLMSGKKTPVQRFYPSLIEITVTYWPCRHCFSVLEFAVSAAVQMNILFGSTAAENQLKSLH